MLKSPDHAHVDEDDFFYQEGGNDEVKDKYGADVAELKVENSGINRERGCTDVLCLLFFWAFIGAMGYATVYGYKNGDVHRLTAPIDGGLNFCGFGSMKGYNKMVLTDFELASGPSILKSGMCVKECPQVKGTEYKDGENCKSNAKIKCDGKKTYKTKDTFDFCWPVDKSALTEKE